MRVLFLGTPAFAALPLRALVAAGHEVVGVVTQPDRPAGRSRTPQAPPVKVAAVELGLPVLQPATLRDPAMVERLRAFQPEVGVVAAYGEILRKDMLDIPPLGYLNIHPSLLPLYRGPTPVAAAILAGDEITGVSIIRLVRAMDAGPIVAQATLPMPPDARSGPLTDELFTIGSQLLVGVLPLYASGELQPQPQDEHQATYCTLLRKEDGLLDWTLPALVIERAIRAYDPWPGAFTLWQGQPLKIGAARVDADWPGGALPGTVLDAPTLRVATGSGALEILEVQPAGKRQMAGLDWLRGQRGLVGQRLGASVEPA
ncbi:MAG TPA: methionyl-tRNA formyltransferase [Herpetosiphonaceae bacterium]